MTAKPVSPLTVRAVRCIGVELPMTYALGTSRGTLNKAPLLLIDLETEEGVTGRSYLWCYFPAALGAVAKLMGEVERVTQGNALAPLDLWRRLAERFRRQVIARGRIELQAAANEISFQRLRNRVRLVDRLGVLIRDTRWSRHAGRKRRGADDRQKCEDRGEPARVKLLIQEPPPR